MVAGRGRTGPRFTEKYKDILPYRVFKKDLKRLSVLPLLADVKQVQVYKPGRRETEWGLTFTQSGQGPTLDVPPSGVRPTCLFDLAVDPRLVAGKEQGRKDPCTPSKRGWGVYDLDDKVSARTGRGGVSPRSEGVGG